MRRETWQALEYCVEKGFAKSIGLSNYTQSHIEEMLEYAKVKPSVLQAEFHPLLCQKELVSLCRAKGIIFQAYSSLGSSNQDSSSLVCVYFFYLVGRMATLS